MDPLSGLGTRARRSLWTVQSAPFSEQVEALLCLYVHSVMSFVVVDSKICLAHRTCPGVHVTTLSGEAGLL